MLRTGVGLKGQGRTLERKEQTLRERKRADASGRQPVEPVQRKDKLALQYTDHLCRHEQEVPTC
jgi:hypothetical protein